MIPSGVAGTSTGSPRNSRPAFSGWNPSTSFVASTASVTVRLVHVLGQRQLHEDPVDTVVRVQLVEQIEHLALGRRRWESGDRASRSRLGDASCFFDT